MKGFGSGRRGQGARRMKQAKPIVATRSADAALGRETRSLLGPTKRGRAAPSGRNLPDLPSLPSLRGRGGGAAIGLRRPLIGRLITPARATGLLGMLASGFLLTFVSGPSAFALARTDVPTLRWTDGAQVQAALAMPDGVNVFQLDTTPLEAALEALPAVAAADVHVSLPDGALVATIHERAAILAWDAGGTRFLADREGVIFAAIPRDADIPGGVAVVEDRRTGSAAGLAIGARLDPGDLDIATRLGSLTPADIGSGASRLRVRVTNQDGYTIYVDKGWTAVFGFYSPATRPTAMIPGQVRLLKSLLAGREDQVARVTLASDTDGTFVPKPTRKPAKP